MAGQTPAEVQEAQRRKRNELIGQQIAQGNAILGATSEDTSTPITDALAMFLDHVRVHSPDKPKTLQRYRKVLEHFERILGKRRFLQDRPFLSISVALILLDNRVSFQIE